MALADYACKSLQPSQRRSRAQTGMIANEIIAKVEGNLGLEI